MKKYLAFDIESHNSGAQYGMTPREFFRLGQYAWNDGPVVLTDDYDEMIQVIREADYVVGHNICAFDLPVLFGVDSLEPLEMALKRKVIDTFVIAATITPAPTTYTDSKGHTYFDAAKPGTAMKWLSLENLCFQFGIPGKFGSLKEIAKRFNPPKTPVSDLDYGLIDIRDEEFRMYAEQDVIAVRGLWEHLKTEIHLQQFSGEYVWREIEIAAAMNRMSQNGILIDQEWARNRIAEMTETRDRILKWLVEEHGFPTTGKAPWASDAGKQVILRVLAGYGVTPETRPDWPRNKPTEKDPKGSLKLGGEDLLTVTEDASDEAREFAQAIASVKGLRSLPQLTIDSMHPDGRVHMDITSLQRSGRWSFTKPGITVFGSREGKDEDKSIFIADEGNVLAGFDFSNADPRAMAALSGDGEFARRFLENDPATGKAYDGHNLSGEALFGPETYYAQLDPKGKPVLRPVSKAAANALNYNIGPLKLASTLNPILRKAGIDMEPFDKAATREMIDKFNESYPLLKRFKDRAAAEGETNGFIVNTWGRRMPIDRDRAWTQAPSLYGQGSVRELMADAILRLIRRGEYYIRALRAVIHDELLLELREDRIEEDIKVVKECMEVPFDPKTRGGIVMPFPVGVGYGPSWRAAGH